jgi:serine/threonine protein kinase
VTEKADVYSYGVVVLEMMTRRRPTDSMFTDGMSLAAWAQSSLHENGNWMEVVDRDLTEEIRDGSTAREMVYNVLTLSLACTREAPKDRPTMSDVVEALLAINQRRQPDPTRIG